MKEDNRVIIALKWSCFIDGLFKYLRDEDILSNGESRKIYADKEPEEGASYIIASSLTDIFDKMQVTKGRPETIFRKYLIDLNLESTMPGIVTGEPVYNLLKSYGLEDRFLGISSIPGSKYQADRKNIPNTSYYSNVEKRNIANFLKK